MKKTVLVTGGAGFIGSNFIYLLLEERTEWKVVCVDALTYAANIHTLNDALNMFVAVKLPDYNEEKRNSIVRNLFFMIDNVLDDMKTPQI